MSESSSDRRAEFEASLEAVRVKSGSEGTERTFMIVGLAVGALGIVVALVAFIMSSGQSDSRDVISSVILGVFGLTLTVAGSAVFLRYSFGRFMRFWLLRMLYEQRGGD